MRATLLFASIAAGLNLAYALDFLAPLQCLQMKDIAENMDIDGAAEMWMEIACKKCEPKLADYRPFLRDQFAVPFTEAEAKSMGTPELSSNYVALLDSLMDMAKEECGATDSTNLCQDTSQIKSVAKCVQSKGWSFILRNIPDFLPIIMSNPCDKQMKYLAHPDLMDKILPAYIKKYAESC